MTTFDRVREHSRRLFCSSDGIQKENTSQPYHFTLVDNKSNETMVVSFGKVKGKITKIMTL